MKNSILFLTFFLSLNFIAAQSTIDGTIERPNGNGVCEVLINLYDANDILVDQDYTEIDGSFSFPNVTNGDGYYFTLEKEDYELNGVSTLDLVIIARGILGISPLSSYQNWVADVNNSGTITSLDLILLRRLILAIDESLNQPIWMFGFTDALTGATTLTLPAITGNTNLEIIGMKLGDVNAGSITNCE